MRIDRDKIQKAPNFRRVIEELHQYLPHEPGIDNIAIIWHEETKEYFINACKQYGVSNPFKEIVSLKNILIRVQKGSVQRMERINNVWKMS